MKKILSLLAISITVSMASSSAYDYLTVTKNMNMVTDSQPIILGVDLERNALDIQEDDKVQPIKIEFSSFWMV